MKGRYVQYTLSEDEVIAECVRQMPLNLSMAFETASKKLDREGRSVEARYYNKVRYMFKMFSVVRIGENKLKDPYIILDKAFIYNVKNLRR